MLLPLLLIAFQPAPNPLAELTVYTGSWTMSLPANAPASAKPDFLVNHCLLADAFYTCEQVVNGKPAALIVFTPADKPHSFHTQTVLPDGHAMGRGDLTLDGDHWTYSSKSTSDDGKVTDWYRTENFFTGRDRIHYELFHSTDGVTWEKKNSGDERRAPNP